MHYKFVYSVVVFCLLQYRVIGMCLISSVFRGLAGNDAHSDSDTLVPADIIDLSIYGPSLYGQPDFKFTGSLVAKLKQNATSVNPEELGAYLEGDILVPQSTVMLKNGLRSTAYRWRNGEVPFEIAGTFQPNELELIAFAMDEYHAKTCIRFKPRTREADYISLEKGNSGCWSSIGRIGGRQQVNLQSPSCLTLNGTVIHELMHVLGFLHEQNRNDRDSYVDILLQNVEVVASQNFRKHSNTDSFGVDYDYGSVMHYSPTAFSRNGQPTIVPKKPTDGVVMGQRQGFSPKDIEKVNRMYNCAVNKKPPAPPVKLQAKPPSRPIIRKFFTALLNKFRRLG